MKRLITKLLYMQRIVHLSILCSISTKYVNFKLKLHNIKIGKHNRFSGNPKIIVYPESKLKIGNKNFFRSDKYSNLIGVNHKCIITTMSKNSELTIGSNCKFSGISIGVAKRVIIGDNVTCGANVIITDTNWHDLTKIENKDMADNNPKSVIINNNVFIGVNSIILKGVTIGQGSIIGANSVVIKDIEENIIAAGNPCVKIKNIKN